MRIAMAVTTALIIVCAGAARADTVELESGDKLEGEILEKNDEQIVMQHPTLGRIVIPMSDVKPAEEEKVEPGLFGTKVLEGWSKALSAGVSGSSGKSKENTANVDLNLNRETERNRMLFASRYFLARSSGNTTENAWDTRYTHDFLFPGHSFFPFLTLNYRMDTQQDWRHRLSGQAGGGYEFVKNEEWEVIGRLGGGISQTLGDYRDHEEPDGNPATRPAKVGPNPVRTEPNALAGLQTLWNYYDGQSLSAVTLYLLDLADVPNYRSESRAEWKLAVGPVEGLAFKLGTSFIYDSHEIGKLKRDFRYYGNLVYDF